MKPTWVTRSFLDYRLPVYRELDRLCDGQLTLIYSRRWTPASVQEKATDLLGDRAIGLTGEWRIGSDGREGFANKAFCLPWQPGLYKKVSDSEPEVLIADGFFRWTPAAIWHRMRKGVPLVMCYERTNHTERNAQWIRTKYRSFVMRWIDAMCCNGSLCADYSASLGMAPDRMTLGHMVADNAALAQQASSTAESGMASPSIENSGVSFLYMGRMLKLKGLYELLDAWARFVQEDRTGAKLVLVGDGPELSDLKKQVSSRSIAKVQFAGRVPYNEVPSCYAAADCFLIPTLEDNWSLVVPEAMACGKPIICSKYNGCYPELIQEGENGWVFDPLNQDEFVATLHSAARSQNRFTDMGDRSREIVSRFTPATAAQSIYDACQIAMAHRNKGTAG